MESLGGLQSVRFIDVAGRRIHYSTLESDILNRTQQSVSYRNYDEENEVFAYSDISVTNQGETKLTLDSHQDRILFSLPFYDSYNIFRGTAVFSLSVRAISDRLLSAGLIKYGEDVSIVSDLSRGVVIGMPRTGKDALMNAVIVVWNEGINTLTPLDSGNGDLSFALISSKTDQGIFVGKVVDEALFAFPFAMKIILLASFFFTTYLIIFLLFNIHQDSMTLIQNRMKRLQINLFEEYYERKGNMDWARWSKELEQRREEVRNEIKQGIKIKPSSNNALDIDTLIDKSWNEMAAVMSAQGQPQLTANIDEEKLSSILNKVLAAAGNLPAAKPEETISLENKPVENADLLISSDEPETLDEAEQLEELTEIDAADTEELGSSEGDASLEELEELDDAAEVNPDDEPADVVPIDDEIVEAVETIEAVEELEEVNPVDETDASLEEAEQVEELSEVEEVDASGADEGDASGSVEGDASGSGELEELEELDDVSDKIAEEMPNTSSPDETRKALTEEDIARLASEIEFADSSDTEADLVLPVEIYSPFGNLIIDADGVEVKKKEKTKRRRLKK
jgi:hypothetical protein